MHGRARGRKGERKTYHVTISPWNLEDIFFECGKKNHARKGAQGRSARGPIRPKKVKGTLDNPPCIQFQMFQDAGHVV